MQNIIFRRIGLLLLCLHIGLMCAVAGQFAKVVNVSTNLNIRESANAQSEIVGKIERDKTVEILSADNGGWTLIKYGSMTGYVKSTYLQPVEISEASTASSGSSSSGLWQTVKDFWNSISPREEDGPFLGVLKILLCILVIAIALGIVGLVLAGVFFFAGIAMHILGAGVAGALIGGFLVYFFSQGKSDSAFTGVQWGFFIGCGVGVIIAIWKPLQAASGGLSAGGKIFDMDSGVSKSPSYTPPAVDSYYDTVIKGAGDFGEDVKAKTKWDGKLEGENGKEYKKNTDSTYSEVE